MRRVFGVFGSLLIVVGLGCSDGSGPTASTASREANGAARLERVSQRVTEASGAPVFQYRGYLQQGAAFSPDATYFKDVAAADLDNDGDIDLYLPQKQPDANPQGGAGSDQGPIIDLVYLNEGDGIAHTHIANAFEHVADPFRFNTGQVLTDRSYDAELVDLDGDGNIDVLRTDRGSDSSGGPLLYYMWGVGDGTFSDPLQIDDEDLNTARNYDDVDTIDTDGDGVVDFFAVAAYGSGRNPVFENQGRSGARLRGSKPDFGTHSVSLGYLKPDGDPDTWDLVFAHLSDSVEQHSSIRLDYPWFAWEAGDKLGTGSDNSVADIVDLDQNGSADVFVGKQGASGHLIVFDAYDAPRVENLGELEQSSFLYDARYADVDLDGNIEIITVDCCSASGTQQHHNAVRVLVDGSMQYVSEEFFGPYDREDDERGDKGAESNHHGNLGLELVDLDGDGDLDMLVAGSEWVNVGGDWVARSAVHVYENTTRTRASLIMASLM